jgi:hypothetical protein
MTVLVYSGTVIIDEQDFDDEAVGQAFADEMQDLGFKVRVTENG